MPAIDECEPQVVNALRKAGWVVADKPYLLRVAEERNIYVDLRFRQLIDSQQMMIVEVKCFPAIRSLLDEFYRAFGQYLFYRTVIKLKQQDTRIYLSVPLSVYENLFGRLSVCTVIEDFDIKLIVIDMQKQEVVQWRH